MDCSPVSPLDGETLMSLPVSFLAGSRGRSFEEVRFLDYQASYREKRRPPLASPPYPTDPAVRAREGLPPLFVPGPLPAAAPNPFLSRSVASIKADYGSKPSHQLVAALANALDEAERTLNFLLQPCAPAPRPPASSHSTPSGAIDTRPTPQLFSSTPIGSETFPSIPTCLPSRATSFFLPSGSLATNPNSNTNTNAFGVASTSPSTSSSTPLPASAQTNINPVGVPASTSLARNTASTALVGKTTSFSVFGARPFTLNPSGAASKSAASACDPDPFNARGIFALPAAPTSPFSDASSQGVGSSVNPTPAPATRNDVDPPSLLGKRSQAPSPSPHRAKSRLRVDRVPASSASASTRTRDGASSGSSVFQRLLKIGTGTGKGTGRLPARLCTAISTPTNPPPMDPYANPDSYGVTAASTLDGPSAAGQDKAPLVNTMNLSALSWPQPVPSRGGELFGFGFGFGGGAATSAYGGSFGCAENVNASAPGKRERGTGNGVGTSAAASGGGFRSSKNANVDASWRNVHRNGKDKNKNKFWVSGGSPTSSKWVRGRSLRKVVVAPTTQSEDLEGSPPGMSVGMGMYSDGMDMSGSPEGMRMGASELGGRCGSDAGVGEGEASESESEKRESRWDRRTPRSARVRVDVDVPTMVSDEGEQGGEEGGRVEQGEQEQD